MPRMHVAAAIAAAGLAGEALAQREPPPANAVTVFGGWSLNNTWEEVFIAPQDLRFEDGGLAGVAVSRRVAEPFEGLSLEVEAQLVRHFGTSTHWEANLPVGYVRWRPLDSLDATAAFGLGLSFSSETPRLEVENEGASQPTMVYWAIELDAALPVEDWRLVGRLHHRSSAYGLFGDDGGLNSLALGLRRRF